MLYLNGWKCKHNNYFEQWPMKRILLLQNTKSLSCSGAEIQFSKKCFYSCIHNCPITHLEMIILSWGEGKKVIKAAVNSGLYLEMYQVKQIKSRGVHGICSLWWSIWSYYIYICVNIPSTSRPSVTYMVCTEIRITTWITIRLWLSYVLDNCLERFV